MISILTLILVLAESLPATIADPGFDRGLDDWEATGHHGYRVDLASNFPARPARRWLHIGWAARSRAPHDAEYRAFTYIDARRYRGRLARFSANLLARGEGARLAIMTEGARAWTALEPGNTWRRQGVVLRIPRGAETIQVSFDLRGGSVVEANDVRIEVLR